MTTSILQKTIVTGTASAVLSLTVLKANPAVAATIVQAFFSGETQFGFRGGCSFYPYVCSLNGQGSISGTFIYNPLETPNYPNENGKPIFLEANFLGLVNSFGLVDSQPNYINVQFSTESVTDFLFYTDYLLNTETSFRVPRLTASISDPNLPELQSIDLFIQRGSRSTNFISYFQLLTPLPGGGYRVLSEGPLEFTEVEEVEVSVPEPSSLFGISALLAFGALSAKNKKHLRKVKKS